MKRSLAYISPFGTLEVWVQVRLRLSLLGVGLSASLCFTRLLLVEVQLEFYAFLSGCPKLRVSGHVDPKFHHQKKETKQDMKQTADKETARGCNSGGSKIKGTTIGSSPFSAFPPIFSFPLKRTFRSESSNPRLHPQGAHDTLHESLALLH